MIKGFTVNEKRLEALDKTIQIQSRMLASALNIEEKEVLNVVDAYSNALTLLDDYDHGTIPKPDGIASVYQLTYEEVVNWLILWNMETIQMCLVLKKRTTRKKCVLLELSNLFHFIL